MKIMVIDIQKIPELTPCTFQFKSQKKTINSILTSGITSKKLDLCTMDFNNTKLFR
jgi:hypothetical protein